jgi:hypothetical protein
VTEEPQARDQHVVDEFRAHGGTVGGTYAKVPLLLLHHTGAKSGTAQITPLAYLADGENWVIFAANSGQPTHPGWYHTCARTRPPPSNSRPAPTKSRPGQLTAKNAKTSATASGRPTRTSQTSKKRPAARSQSWSWSGRSPKASPRRLHHSARTRRAMGCCGWLITVGLAVS